MRNAERRERLRADALWQANLSGPVGRQQLWDILAVAGAFRPRFAVAPNGTPDLAATWFAAGRQQLGFELFLSWLRADPEGAVRMLRENHPDLRPPEKKRREPERDPWSEQE